MDVSWAHSRSRVQQIVGKEKRELENRIHLFAERVWAGRRRAGEDVPADLRIEQDVLSRIEVIGGPPGLPFVQLRPSTRSYVGMDYLEELNFIRPQPLMALRTSGVWRVVELDVIVANGLLPYFRNVGPTHANEILERLIAYRARNVGGTP